MNATTTQLNTSHVPRLSRPEEVAAVIMEAAAKGTATKPWPQTAAVDFETVISAWKQEQFNYA